MNIAHAILYYELVTFIMIMININVHVDSEFEVSYHVPTCAHRLAVHVHVCTGENTWQVSWHGQDHWSRIRLAGWDLVGTITLSYAYM